MKLVRVFSQCQTIFSGFRGLVPRCEACFVAEETARYHSGYLVTQTKCQGIGSTKDLGQKSGDAGTRTSCQGYKAHHHTTLPFVPSTAISVILKLKGDQSAQWTHQSVKEPQRGY